MTGEGASPRSRRRRLIVWGLPTLAVAAAVGAAVLAGTGDGRSTGAAPTDASRSSSIAWAPGGGALLVASPDDDRLVEVDPSGLEVARTIDLWGQPRQVTVLGDEAVVTAARSTDLAVVDLAPNPDDPRADHGVVVDPVQLPCGRSEGVVTVPEADGGPPRPLALVTCPDDDLVAVVDLDRREAVATIPLTGRPTGIVRDGGVVTVTTVGDGRLHTLDVAAIVDGVRGAEARSSEDDPPPALRVRPTSSRRPWIDGDRTASSLAAVTVGPRGPVGVYQVVDNQRKLTRAEIEAGSTYGSPKDGRARLEPAVAGACGARFASLTDEARRLSGPVAVAAQPDGDLVWVVGEFSHSVSVIRCDGGASSGRSATVAAFDVGEGARGIVLSPDGRRAYVDVGFDHQVAELRLPDDVDGAGAAGGAGDADPIERTAPARVGRRSVDDRYLSPLAQQGRRMFNDATNTHMTPFGVVTCGSCHPSAGEDGLSWRIESADPATRQIQRKVRRTLPAWQVDPAVKPLHWDGAFTSSDALTLDTVQRLLGGDGLLVDTAAISAYMAEVLPPGPPPADVGGSGDAVEGERVAEAKGCTSCHAGDTGTDGKAHDVLSPSTVTDGALAAVVTPSLIGVRGRAPYGHDGRAPTLEALLAEHGDGKGGTIALTPQERADVIAYLESR